MNEAKGAFGLGDLVATTGAIEKVPRLEMLVALARHSTGDWGDMPEEDKKSNDRAVKNGDERIMSSYTTKDGTKFWIITEWDRSVTTILLPEEY